MIKLTAHAAERIEEQGISLAWVDAVLAAPERTQVNPDDPTLTRAWRAIPEFGGRMLRVVHRPVDADVLVITAHWDRGAG